MSNFKRWLFGGSAMHRLLFKRVQVSSTSYAPEFGWRPA